MIGVRLQGTAIDLARWKPPQRQVIDKHGEPATEKLPTQRSRLMLNLAGHRVWVALHSGSGNRNPNDPMALRIVAEKQAKGFLPLDTCPQTLGAALHPHLPKELRGRRACSLGGDERTPISSSNPCGCLLGVEAARTAVHVRKAEEIERRYQSQQERERELRERQITALEQQNGGNQMLLATIADLQRQIAELRAGAAPSSAPAPEAKKKP